MLLAATASQQVPEVQAFQHCQKHVTLIASPVLIFFYTWRSALSEESQPDQPGQKWVKNI